MATPAQKTNPKSPYVFTEARRRAALQNLEKAHAAQARRLAERRGSPEEAERARARAERRFQKRQQYRREHGFFFFRRWGLYVVSFARSMQRLGESVVDFERLWEWCETWLGVREHGSGFGARDSGLGACSSGISSRKFGSKSTDFQSMPAKREPEPRIPKAEPSPLIPDAEPRAPSPEPRIHHTPQPRTLLSKLARSLAQVIWLGRRVRRCLDYETAVRLEARLLTMAELQAILRGDHGAEAQARLLEHLGRVMGPELDEYKNLKMFGADPELVWPRRLRRRLMEMILEVVDDRPDRHEELARLRRRMKGLLREGSGVRGQGAGNCRLSIDDCRLKSELPAGSPLFQDHGSGSESANSEPCEILRSKNDGQQTTDDGQPDNRQSTIENRQLQSPESRNATAENTSSALSAGRTPEEKYWARYDRLSPAAHHRRLGRERREADQHGLTIEEFRDRRWLKAAEALSRYFWKAGQGWFGESRHQERGTQRYPVRESYAAGPEAWWPEAREMEIRAEVEWHRHSCLRDSGSTAGSGCATAHTCLAYSELKRLLAAAFGLQGRGERPETRDELVVGCQPSVVSEPLSDSRDEKGETSTPDRGGETRPVRGLPNPQSRVPPALSVVEGSPNDLLVSRLSPLVSGNPSLVSRPLERVARLLWLIVHTGEGDARREERQLEVETRNSKLENRTSNEGGQSSILDGESPELRVGIAQTPNSELSNSEPRDSELKNSEPAVTRHLLNALQTHDAEADFRRAERQARLSEALRRLGQALYPEPIEARTELGYLYRLKDEFDRLRLDPLWFDAGRKAVLRQDLGLDPLPEGFETPELPEELLDPRSAERRHLLRDAMRSMQIASWRGRREAEWEEERIGTLFTPEDAREIESGRLSVDEWRSQYFAVADECP